MPYSVTFYRASKAIRLQAPRGRAALGVHIVPAGDDRHYLWDKGVVVGLSLAELGGMLRALNGKGEFRAIHRPGGGFSAPQSPEAPMKNIYMGYLENDFVISIIVGDEKHTFALNSDEVEVVKQLVLRAMDTAMWRPGQQRQPVVAKR